MILFDLLGDIIYDLKIKNLIQRLKRMILKKIEQKIKSHQKNFIRNCKLTPKNLQNQVVFVHL